MVISVFLLPYSVPATLFIKVFIYPNFRAHALSSIHHRTYLSHQSNKASQTSFGSCSAQIHLFTSIKSVTFFRPATCLERAKAKVPFPPLSSDTTTLSDRGRLRTSLWTVTVRVEDDIHLVHKTKENSMHATPQQNVPLLSPSTRMDSIPLRYLSNYLALKLASTWGLQILHTTPIPNTNRIAQSETTLEESQLWLSSRTRRMALSTWIPSVLHTPARLHVATNLPGCE